MTSGQPPQPPVGGQPPHGQQPPGYGTPGQPAQQPWGQQPPAPGRQTGSLNSSKVGLFDGLIAGAALLFTLLMILPWFGFDDEGFEDIDASTNGFSDTIGFGAFNVDIGYATWPAVLAWLLLLAAAVWVLLPALTTLRLPVPARVVTVALTGLALLLILITWVDTFSLADGVGDEAGFSFIAFLALLTAIAAFALALVQALPELRALRAGSAKGGAPQHGSAVPPAQQFSPPPPPASPPTQQFSPPPPPPPPAGGPHVPGEGSGPDRPV